LEQVVKCHVWAVTLSAVCNTGAFVLWCVRGHKEGENRKVTPISNLEFYSVRRRIVYFFPPLRNEWIFMLNSEA